MESDWRSFWKTTLVAVLAVAAVVYGAVLIVDPYDTVFFSPPFNRAPVTTNQRFSFPALARKARFDSAIVGTSTTRMLRPEALDRTIGGSFVNLSMNSGTAWEQSQILKLFVRHHPRPRTMIFGIDIIWCQVEKESAKLTFRPFPPWMYDDNPWNDLLHLFDLKTLEQTGLQFAWLTRIHPEPRHGLDGYTPLRPASEYDLVRARGHIYGDSKSTARAPVTPPYRPTPAERAAWPYASHALLAEMLELLPPETTKVLLFVPYHAFNLPVPGSKTAAQWRECKRRITEMAARVPNAHVLDFMIPSRITRRDENYWDPLHYGAGVAEQLAELIAKAVAARRGVDDVFHYLRPEDFAQ